MEKRQILACIVLLAVFGAICFNLGRLSERHPGQIVVNEDSRIVVGSRITADGIRYNEDGQFELNSRSTMVLICPKDEAIVPWIGDPQIAHVACGSMKDLAEAGKAIVDNTKDYQP